KDLLVVAGRTYACTLVADEGSDVAITLSFSAPADGGPSFEAETNERITFTCACDSKGSAGQPAFFAARSFTCVTGDGPLVSVLRGRVSGRSAQAIKQMSGWGAGHGVVGACVLP
ncbi:MAG: hypothetical protein ACRERC_03880, partial [Candidatus Binatia bacterium]